LLLKDKYKGYLSILQNFLRTFFNRYFYFIGNKKQIAEMKKDFNYEVLPYPKGDNERYDAGYKPTVQMPLF
jgi:hypothetical protein